MKLDNVVTLKRSISFDLNKLEKDNLLAFHGLCHFVRGVVNKQASFTACTGITNKNLKKRKFYVRFRNKKEREDFIETFEGIFNAEILKLIKYKKTKPIKPTYKVFQFSA